MTVPYPFYANSASQRWCGQSQPHNPHTWTEGYMGTINPYYECAGHTGTIDITSITCEA